MEYKDSVSLSGRIKAILCHADGSYTEYDWTPNTVVNAGKAVVAGLLNGVVTNFFDYIAIGTGSTAPAAGQTALVTEITTNGGQRAASTNTRVTTTVTNDTAQLSLTYTFTGTLTGIAETGIFDASSSGNMLARTLFSSAMNVVNTDVLTVVWQIKVS